MGNRCDALHTLGMNHTMVISAGWEYSPSRAHIVQNNHFSFESTVVQRTKLVPLCCWKIGKGNIRNSDVKASLSLRSLAFCVSMPCLCSTSAGRSVEADGLAFLLCQALLGSEWKKMAFSPFPHHSRSGKSLYILQGYLPELITTPQGSTKST